MQSGKRLTTAEKKERRKHREKQARRYRQPKPAPYVVPSGLCDIHDAILDHACECIQEFLRENDVKSYRGHYNRSVLRPGRRSARTFMVYHSVVQKVILDKLDFKDDVAHLVFCFVITDQPCRHRRAGDITPLVYDNKYSIANPNYFPQLTRFLDRVLNSAFDTGKLPPNN